MVADYIHNNPRVFGSFLIGIALVSGAYVISNFGKPSAPRSSATVAISPTLLERSFIPVVDADGNGIEDWREEFVLREGIILPVVLDEITYEPPTTLTGKVSEQFFESILRSKINGIGPTNSDIVTRTADTITRVSVTDGLYNTSNIIVVPTTNSAIRTYANTMGLSITSNDIKIGYENELTIMQRALENEDDSELKKLIPHTSMYKALRDEALKTPTPQSLVKQHLDVINAYHALYKNLSDMQLAFEDPMVSLMRVKRYQDDALGLKNSLVNLYNALVPHAGLFTREDPAVVFAAFSPNFQ